MKDVRQMSANETALMVVAGCVCMGVFFEAVLRLNNVRLDVQFVNGFCDERTRKKQISRN